MGELNRGKFAPRERFAYAVVMDGGWYVGIWKDEETAKLVAAKHPKGEVRKMESCAESEIEPKVGERIGYVCHQLANDGKSGHIAWIRSTATLPENTQIYAGAVPSQPAAEGTPRRAAVNAFVNQTRMRQGECTGYESALLSTLYCYADLLDTAEAALAAAARDAERYRWLRDQTWGITRDKTGIRWSVLLKVGNEECDTVDEAIDAARAGKVS
jgi:hypothetical protein